MSQSMSMSRDPEVGREPDEQVDHRQNDPRGDPTTTSNNPLQGESNFGDSSGPLFSIYSKTAEVEDNNMVERWQKDAEGILIFTGLFSAAVAALLAVTVQDLRPNSQDTSAYYLGNIYQVLADPNVTHSSTPFPVAKPPSFSPSRYAVWVNTLWFLSLLMSLSCALWAISLQRWSRQYLRRAQPFRCNPEKRARMRAFFADGVDSMRVSWAVEGLPALLHLSLFLFFGGVAIFLFHVDREVFSYVIWWIGLFCLVYGMITVLPFICTDSPYSSPLSALAWFLITIVAFMIGTILACEIVICYWICRRLVICFCADDLDSIYRWIRLHADPFVKYFRRWISNMIYGVEKMAEEVVSERLSKIDSHILDWTITTLGDDESLKKFFEAIPGFINSKLMKHLEGNLPEKLFKKYMDVLNGFLDRTRSSNSVEESEKLRRVDIATNAMSLIRFIDRDAMPQVTTTRILLSLRERDDRWIALAARAFSLMEQDLRENIALGDDSVLLVIFIHVTRRWFRSLDFYFSGVLEELYRFDIRNTLPRLQHDFCALWNEIAQEARKEARKEDPNITPLFILRGIRQSYIALHQGTDAAPTAFSASTGWLDVTLLYPSSYPLCNLASHRPDSIAQIPVPNSGQVPLPTQPASPLESDNTASQQAEHVNNVTKPPSSSHPMATSDIGATSHGPDITPPTNSVHSSSRPTGASPAAVVAAVPQNITSTATLSHPLEGGELRDSDIDALSAKPGTTSQILSTTSTHPPLPTLAPIPTSTPKSCEARVTSVSDSSHIPLPSIGSFIPASRPTGDAMLPRLRARGLVNTGNMCFANAILQLLVNIPPYWNLFRELGDLKGQRGPGAPGTGGGATPLVDATVRFFNEFMVEEQPSTQQQSQPTGGTSRADEERNDDNIVDSFEPAYLYDAMKEKRQLKHLLDGQQQDAEEFLRLYLDALDEELSVLSGRQSASAVLEVEEREVSQSGQTEVESQGPVASFVESPITRIFGGKFRSLVRTSNKPDVVTTEDWRSLHLDVLPDSVLTVQDALLRVSQSQSLRDGASSSGDSDASQQMLIEALPPVLILHLKRFRYDEAAGGVIKIDKPVQFSPELDIPFDVMVPTVGQPANPAHYMLCGVLYHHGESAGGGHYTVDILHPPNGDGDTGKVWLHIDDEAVSAVRHEDVFGEHSDERCAYLLFYCRTSPKDTS